MTNTEKAVAFSNGEWKNAKDLARHLGVKNPSDTPLKNMFSKNGITFEVERDEFGRTVRYRASFIENCSPVDIAKARKAKGLLFGLESISILGGAA